MREKKTLPDNTQLSQELDIHARGEIRTHNPSKRAAVDLRLRLRGHWGRPYNFLVNKLWDLKKLSRRKKEGIRAQRGLLITF
jgi:hypothetical protein